MARITIPAISVIILLLINCSAQSVPPKPARTESGNLQSAPPVPGIFAPYVHMTESSNDLAVLQATSGTRFFTLAFVISDGGCTAAWQGKASVPVAAETAFSSHIAKLRAAGGDVIISFGGYLGPELAEACTDAASLKVAYQSVVDKYKPMMLDFDIESSSLTHPASTNRRNQAIKLLVSANPGLQISFTLPVLPSGLEQGGLDLLKNAISHGVPISVVNLMTMDYGYPIPEGNMGTTAISAAAAAVMQLQSLGLNAYLGITPMIGMNDSPGEIFTTADARSVLRYAKANDRIRRLSMWSVGRDNGSCRAQVTSTCSGIEQKAWEFSQIFQAF